MIDPDYFGCSGKLSFAETRALATAEGTRQAIGDFSELVSDGRLVTSIDRIHRCAKDWTKYARIALNHAFGDVACAGATPIQAMLSFEFGIDSDAADQIACSRAFAEELAARGVALGKCHSSKTGGVTAVTVATLASAPIHDHLNLGRGSIYINRPIGALKLHYLAEMKVRDDDGASKVLERPIPIDLRTDHWTIVTDVSGHGLLGAALHAAGINGLDIKLELSPIHLLHPDVTVTPVECLQNPIDSYGLPLSDLHPSAVTIATLRETAGPLLGFIEAKALAGLLAPPNWILIGQYEAGTGKVDISWHE